MLSTVLLRQLTAQVQELQATATHLYTLGLSALNAKPTPMSWSALECLEHLNRYSRFYNEELATALRKAAPAAVAPHEVGFTWLGRKSYDTVRPDNGKKHTTIKNMDPSGSQLGVDVLQEFMQHQTQLLRVLTTAQGTNLNRKAVRIEFFKLLKLRVGEALQFLVAHEQRHVQQALRAAQHPAATSQSAPLLVV